MYRKVIKFSIYGVFPVRPVSGVLNCTQDTAYQENAYVSRRIKQRLMSII